MEGVQRNLVKFLAKYAMCLKMNPLDENPWKELIFGNDDSDQVQLSFNDSDQINLEEPQNVQLSIRKTM